MLLPSILALLFPLAVYCWVLGAINRRPYPTMLTGFWDNLGMLLALSGVLLVVGPVLLNRIFDSMLESISPEEDFALESPAILRAWEWSRGLYYALMTAGVLALLWARRNKTVIYNAEPEMFEHVLRESLERMGLAYHRLGNRWAIGQPPVSNPGPSEALIAGEPPQKALVQRADYPPLTPLAIVEVEVFPTMSHVTLHWLQSDDSLRDRIEAQIRRNLAEARTFDNPAGTWFLGMTGFFFGLIFLTGLVLALTTYFPRRL